MKMLKQVGMVMALGVGTLGLAQAHHAANSQFDGNKNVVYTGVLQRMYIGNPHSYLYFVSLESGQAQQKWTFETEAVLALRRAGLSVRDSLRIGNTYSLVYSPALDGSKAGLMSAIRLSDGRVIAFSTKDQQTAADKLLAEKLLNSTPNSQSPQ